MKNLPLYCIFVALAACGQSNGAGNSSGGAIGRGDAALGNNGGSGIGGLGAGGVTDAGRSPATGGTQSSGGIVSTGGATAGGTGGSSGAVGTGGSNPGGGTSAPGGSGGGGSNIGGSSGGATGGSSIGGSSGGATGGLNVGGSSGGATGGGTTGTGGQTGTGGAIGSDGGSAANVTIVPDPSWTCGMADGIPPPTAGTLVFSLSLTLSATHDVGNTQFGHRRQLDVSGGSITGDKLKGTVLTGGLDYELTLSNGAMELEEILIWKTSDNTNIFAHLCGVAAAGDSVVRIVPDIEAPTSGSYAWLNTTKLVGTRVVDVVGNKIQLDIYDVSKVAVADPKIQLKDPAGVPNVSWDCVTGSGSQGASVFTENVTLGSTVVVSNAKRGSRNIIAITGGTTTGKEAGSILNGGADYQLATSSGTTLDARYTLAPGDGEFIIVRNCGPMNGLIPTFEARVDGTYAFLTQNKYMSSAPGSGSGGVSITFYERK